jgi:hypothetical protein
MYVSKALAAVVSIWSLHVILLSKVTPKKLYIKIVTTVMHETGIN